MGKLVNFQPLSMLTPESVSRSDRKTIQQVTNECTGVGDKSDYASVVATINALREQAPLTYAACTTEGCGKKVIEEGIQMYRCERCARSMDRCDHRYSFQIQIGDDTGSIWASVFNETGAVLTGRPAEEVHHMPMNIPLSMPTLSIRSKGVSGHSSSEPSRTTYGGETRVKYSIPSPSSLWITDGRMRF